MMVRGLLAIAFCGAILAQAPAPQPEPAKPQQAEQAKPEQAEPKPPAPIRVEVNEVIVPVTVTDYKGRFISNLEQSDFKIFDNGQEQKIKYFSRERGQPVVVGFVMDLSSSTRLHWKTFQEAAADLVFSLLPVEDREKRYSGFLVTFSTDAELAVNTTHDPDPIVEKIRKSKPGGGAALYDAIHLAITRHSQVKGEPIEPRRVLVVIGDGNDNASKYTLDQIVELSQRNLVTVYGVSTTAYGFTSEGDANLRRLAEETGGRVEYPLQNVYKDIAGQLSKPQDAGNYAITVESGGYTSEIAKSIFSSIANVAGEVTTQYILRYVPTVTDSQPYRNLRIEVNVPDAKVRARKGYYATTP